MKPKKRLFIGIAIPPQTRAELAVFVDNLKRRLPMIQATWVPERSYHLTLEFLGTTDRELEILKALKKLPTAPFSLTLSGMGAFPRPSFARVLWVGAESILLANLARQVELALQPVGFIRHETEAFQGHLTLARLGAPALVGEAVKAEKNIRFNAFAVEEIHIYESKTTPEGTEYQILHAIPLTGTPPKT